MPIDAVAQFKQAIDTYKKLFQNFSKNYRLHHFDDADSSLSKPISSELKKLIFDGTRFVTSCMKATLGVGGTQTLLGVVSSVKICLNLCPLHKKLFSSVMHHLIGKRRLSCVSKIDIFSISKSLRRAAGLLLFLQKTVDRGRPKIKTAVTHQDRCLLSIFSQSVPASIFC